jgi:hypothetical protein
MKTTEDAGIRERPFNLRHDLGGRFQNGAFFERHSQEVIPW